MFMANMYTVNKKLLHSSSSRFNSDQTCMFVYLRAVIEDLHAPSRAFFPEHSHTNIHSNCHSFVLWICILLGSSKTGQNHGNQRRAVWAVLSEPQQAAGTSAASFSQWQKDSTTHIWVFGLNFQRSICDEHRKWNTLRSVEIWDLDFSNILILPLPHWKKHLPSSGAQRVHTLKWKTVEGNWEGSWHYGLLSLHYRHHAIQKRFW